MSSPAAVPPELDPTKPYHGYKVIITTAVSFAIATTSIILRLVSRWICRKRLEANDYLILAAYPFKLGIDIASVMLLIYGIGKPILVVMQEDPNNLTNYAKTLYVGSWVYAPCIGFVKLSILSLYYSAFPSRYLRTACWIVGAIVVAWAIACCLVGLLACIPIHAVWDPTVHGRCINYGEYYYGLQIPNIITDVIILVLPFKAVYDLQMPRTQTIQVCGVLGIGVLTTAFDIVRLVVLVQTPNGGDQTYNQVAASMWTDLEPSVAVMAACLPIMRPLVHPRRFWRMARDGNRSDSQQELDETEMDEQDHKTYYESNEHEKNSNMSSEDRRDV